MRRYAQLQLVDLDWAPQQRKEAIKSIKPHLIFMIGESCNEASNTAKSDSGVFGLQVYLQYITTGFR